MASMFDGVAYWIAAVSIAWVAWFFVYRAQQMRRKGPRQWPVLGSVIEIQRNFGRLHDWNLEYFKDGTKTYSFQSAVATVINTVDPDNVEYMLKSNFANYGKGGNMRERMQDFLGSGIFNADGDVWRRHRKLASLEFSSHKLRDYSTKAFRADALNLLNLLDRAMSRHESVDCQELLMRMTLDSICKVGFGVDLGCCSALMPDVPFASAFDKVSELIFGRQVSFTWKLQRALNIGPERELRKGLEVLDAFTYSVIKNRRAEINEAEASGKEFGREDLLSRFMAFRKDQEDGYSDRDLRDAILNFVIAGRDTTAITLSWFFYCVCLNPEVSAKVYEESIAVLGNQGSYHDVAERLTFEAVSKMHYLHAALSETLRLYPAVPRDAKLAHADDVLPDGTKVRKGDVLVYVPYAMGRMAALWGADALQFKPERWLKNGVFQPESPYKFTAFQAGPRMCLGKDSAYLQMKLTAALLLRFFKFELVPGHAVTYKVTLVMPMKYGLHVHVSCC